jgi:hypothetical protein
MHRHKAFVLLTLAVFVLAGAGIAAAGNSGHGDDGKKKHKWKNPPATFRNEFALFDGSNPANQPDSGAICGANVGKPFTYHLAVSNYGSDGFIRITYVDGDWVQFPIAAGASFSLTQAGGSKGGADAAIRVSNGGSAAALAGVMSATGARCGSCDAIVEGGIGDLSCDVFVENLRGGRRAAARPPALPSPPLPPPPRSPVESGDATPLDPPARHARPRPARARVEPGRDAPALPARLLERRARVGLDRSGPRAALSRRGARPARSRRLGP